ncbi:hypothetical protein H8959_013574 [Pygathrix nigripes]
MNSVLLQTYKDNWGKYSKGQVVFLYNRLAATLTFEKKAVSFADAAAARSPLLPAMVNPTMVFNIAVDGEPLGCVSFDVRGLETKKRLFT